MREYGVSVDLGTSQITIHLFDLQSGNLAYELIFENPQNFAGLDVISRIMYTKKNPLNSMKLTTLIRKVMNRGIREIVELSNSSFDQVSSIVIVGNTVMHHFFYGLPCDSLLRPPYLITRKEAIHTTAYNIDLELEKDVLVYSPPLVESYVGADTIAMILASELLNQTHPSLAIDIGTNTEIALWDGDWLRICSAASGPAFEGMSLDCGCNAIEGAIEKVEISGPDYRPIGSSRPKGICGTGAISTLSSMMENGLIDSKGSILQQIESSWMSYSENVTKYILAHAVHSETGKPIYISQFDIRMLQKSKAAIRGGIEYLLDHTSYKPNQIEYVYITGAFGSRLNINDAFRIGLFPRFSNARIMQVEHGASNGADLILSKPILKSKAEDLVNRIQYIELTDNAMFNQFYVQSQMFDNQF
jgi:uncharacterized 2Fe-2S/4Fe-4S cluster protein (DUF4445 family)